MANRIKSLPNSKKSAPSHRFPQFGNLGKQIYLLKQKLDLRQYLKNIIFYIEKKPFVSFFSTLFILLVIILLGSTFFGVKTTKIDKRTLPKNVKVFTIGESAKLKVQGEVKKGGVITIVAQVPGIVSSINFKEGAWVNQGKTLISLSSNYQGENIATLQRQLSAISYQNTKDTYDTQKEIIQKQREIANTQSENSDKLKDITQVSINDTRDLLNLNTNIINQLKTNITTLQNSNANPSDILTLQQILSQVQSGTNQLSSMLRANEYQTNTNNPPKSLENIGKEITLKQLDLQEKALNMSLQATSISLKLATVQEQNMFPSSPFSGVIQKIHVKVGQNVNPGTPLITFSADKEDITIDVRVSKEIADKVSKTDPSEIILGDEKINTYPLYISTDATNGQLYSIIYSINEKYKNLFTNGSYIPVTIPIGHKIDSPIIFIPLDSIFQTQKEAYVFVVENNRAKSKKVILGDVSGGYVAVEKGLNNKDKIILDRTIIDGDPVTIQN